MSMLLKMVRGCMADSLTVDGKEEMDLTSGERKEVLKRIFDHLGPKDLNEVMQVLIERFGDCETDGQPCETCGDYVDTYTWEV